MIVKKSLIIMPFLAVAVPVSAQENLQEACPDVLDGCTILVTGNLDRARSERAEAIDVVNIEQALQTRVEQFLDQIAGVQQFRRSDARSANPTGQGVTLRGLGGNASSRALLILDGVPQADPFGGWVAWPGYDAVNLAGLRVRKGAGISSAGPGAIAGVIELDSRQNWEATGISASYGSRDSIWAKANIERKLGGGSISASANYARGDGFIPIVKSQRGNVDHGAGFEQYGIALRAVAPIGDDTELQANIRAYEDERDRGFEFSDNRNSGVDASLRLVNRAVDGWQWSALTYIQIRDFSNRFGSVSSDRNSVNLVLDQFSVPSTGLGARFEIRPPVGDDAELRIGGDWRRTIGETNENFFFTGDVPGRNRNAGGRTDIYGAFLEGSWNPVTNLVLNIGGRVDRWDIANGSRREINIGGSVRSNEIFDDRSAWEGTARAGFAYHIQPSLKLRGAAYTGWRLPTLNELYRPFRVGVDATAANELLSPERLRGAELGVDYLGGRISFGATVFVNQLDDAIANIVLAQGPGTFPGVGFVGTGGIYRQRSNLDNIDSKGVELDTMIFFGPVTLNATYAYIDAQVRASGIAAGLDNLRPAQVPRHFANANVEYARDMIKIFANIHYVGGQFEDEVNDRYLNDAITVGGGISYRIHEKIRMELSGENLFDEQVDAAISGTGVIERANPRTIWFGVSVEL